MIPVRIPREAKNRLVEDLQTYVREELSEDIGNLAAEGLLDYVQNLIGPFVYNQAIDDARNVFVQQSERTDEELNVLFRPIEQRIPR